MNRIEKMKDGFYHYQCHLYAMILLSYRGFDMVFNLFTPAYDKNHQLNRRG